MAKVLSPVLLLITLSLFHSITTARLTDHELLLAILALRSHGYTLFSDAITTFDLRNRHLTSRNSTLTLFSPTDSLLLSLDLDHSAAAPLYTRSLLYHVSPCKLTTSHLRNLASASYVNTLLPHRRLLIGNAHVSSNGSVLDSFTVDGVRISVPDLFVGSNIAVHGLEGILVAGFDWENDEEDYAGEVGHESPAVCSNEKAVENSAEMMTCISSSKNRGVSDGNCGKAGHGKFSKFNHPLGL